MSNIRSLNTSLDAKEEKVANKLPFPRTNGDFAQLYPPSEKGRSSLFLRVGTKSALVSGAAYDLTDINLKNISYEEKAKDETCKEAVDWHNKLKATAQLCAGIMRPGEENPTLVVGFTSAKTHGGGYEDHKGKETFEKFNALSKSTVVVETQEISGPWLENINQLASRQDSQGELKNQLNDLTSSISNFVLNNIRSVARAAKNNQEKKNENSQTLSTNASSLASPSTNNSSSSSSPITIDKKHEEKKHEEKKDNNQNNSVPSTRDGLVALTTDSNTIEPANNHTAEPPSPIVRVLEQGEKQTFDFT